MLLNFAFTVYIYIYMYIFDEYLCAIYCNRTMLLPSNTSEIASRPARKLGTRGDSMGKEISSRFVRGRYAQLAVTWRSRDVCSSRRKRVKNNDLSYWLGYSLSQGKKRREEKKERERETAREEEKQLDVKWLGDLNASILRESTRETRLWNTHARHFLGPPIKGDYAATLPFERRNFSPGNICQRTRHPSTRASCVVASVVGAFAE